MTLAELIDQFGEQQVVAFFLVLARVSPLFLIAPLFSSKSVPARVRGTIAVALAIGLGPVVGRDAQIDLDTWNLVGLLGKEILVGASFAFVLAAFFAAIQVAGSFLDTLIGFAYGGLIDPITGNQSAVLTQLYAFIGVAVFIAIGGDAWVIEGMARTYDVVPMDAYPQITAIVRGADAAFVGVFAAAIQVAGPVVLALIVTDAAFGVVSRVVPQLNVFAVGFPAKVFVGLLLIGTSLPFVAGWFADELQTSVGQALKTLQVAG
ncbi:flagellar biosynthetic protein FliR [Paraconexibacter sp.]|uniref:flagellar biosynthetic protein FliR n=1 Tax=Paraconexibacter sp. TaxID=2949640 RepID=UPI0035640B10